MSDDDPPSSDGPGTFDHQPMPGAAELDVERSYEPDEERTRAFVSLFMAAATDEEDAA